MEFSNENTLPAENGSLIQENETAENTAGSEKKAEKEKFDWFGKVADAGELLFDALKTLAKYVSYGFLWLVAAFLRGWARVSKVLKRFFARVA